MTKRIAGLAAVHTLQSPAEIRRLLVAVALALAACGAPLEARPDLDAPARTDGGTPAADVDLAEPATPTTPEVLTVSLLAGAPGLVGADDGAAADARFQHPVGAEWDGVDTLYIADTDNHVIRALSLATRRVSTLAGKAGEMGSVDGTGDAARFTAPQALAVVGDLLYVADTDAHAIRRLDLVSHEVTTLAGTLLADGAADGNGPTARFRFPKGLVADGTTALYVADSYNHAIRRVSLPDAGAVVAHGEVPRIAVVGGRDLDQRIGAARVLDRVSDEVQEHLADDLDAGVAGRHHELDDVAQELADVDGFDLFAHAAGARIAEMPSMSDSMRWTRPRNSRS
jgi:sugar lactone lactonase YvrE